MKRKLFSAILFGAFLIASTSGLTSCKDYDDDISNLQSQIDKLATADQLSAKVSELQSAISAAQSAAEAKAAAAETVAKAAQSAADAAATAAKNAQSTADGASQAAKDAAAAAAAAAEVGKAAQAAVNALEAKAATKEELNAAAEAMTAVVTQIQADHAADKAAIEASIETAKTDLLAKINANTEALNALALRLDAVEEKLGMGAEGEEIDLTEIQNEIEAIAEILEDIVGTYSTMITGVSLWKSGEEYYSAKYNNNAVSFISVEEKDNTFPAEAGRVAEDPFTFTKGFFRTTDDDNIVIRITPANAVLDEANITLVNSQGKDLSDLVECTKVEHYNDLLTRSASGSETGLYRLTFKLKDGYDAAAFKAATEKKVNGEDKKIIFAVAVKTPDQDYLAERIVTSEWNIAINNGVAYPAYDFTVNKTSINDIRNRYSVCEDGTTTTLGVKELVWNVSTTKNPTPATAATKDNSSDRRADIDNRQDKAILAVNVGEDINIVYPMKDAAGNYTPIKGFYVALDYAFALESQPSELNAWNSYEYENVTKLDKDGKVIEAGKLFEGHEGTIKINSQTANNDVIGFRVYAVNLDGTLVDPDGRAFYVGVGQAATANVIEGEVVADKAVATSDFVDVTDVFVAGNYSGWVSDSKNPTYGPGNAVSPVVGVLTYDKDKKATTDMSKVKYVKFQLNTADQYIDGATYTQTINVTKTVGAVTYPVKTITAKITKVMPKAFPKDFSFRPKQEIEEGSGKFRAYMIPNNWYNVVNYDGSDNTSTYGYKDFNNVFYGLNDNYQFVIKKSQKVGNDLKDIKVTNSGNSVSDGVTSYHYTFSVANDPFIKNHTECAVEASYLYKGVSTYKDGNNWKVGADYPVAYDKSLTMVYACWHDAETYAWGTYRTGAGTAADPYVTHSLQPAPQWTQYGVTTMSHLSNIEGKNSYNDDFFGLNLYQLIINNKWLKIKDGGVVMKYKDPTTGVVQTNPYFIPKIYTENTDPYDWTDSEGNTHTSYRYNAGDIVFKQWSVQVDAAPVADHVEQLIITVVDAYGHEYEISSDVTVKKPNTATAQ